MAEENYDDLPELEEIQRLTPNDARDPAIKVLIGNPIFKMIEYLDVTSMERLCMSNQKFRQFCQQYNGQIYQYMLSRDFNVPAASVHPNDAKIIYKNHRNMTIKITDRNQKLYIKAENDSFDRSPREFTRLYGMPFDSLHYSNLLWILWNFEVDIDFQVGDQVFNYKKIYPEILHLIFTETVRKNFRYEELAGTHVPYSSKLRARLRFGTNDRQQYSSILDLMDDLQRKYFMDHVYGNAVELVQQQIANTGNLDDSQIAIIDIAFNARNRGRNIYSEILPEIGIPRTVIKGFTDKWLPINNTYLINIIILLIMITRKAKSVQ